MPLRVSRAELVPCRCRLCKVQAIARILFIGVQRLASNRVEPPPGSQTPPGSPCCTGAIWCTAAGLMGSMDPWMRAAGRTNESRERKKSAFGPLQPRHSAVGCVHACEYGRARMPSLSLSLVPFLFLPVQEARPPVFQAQTTRGGLPGLPMPPAAVIGRRRGPLQHQCVRAFWGGVLEGGNAGWQLDRA
ncbi:hypothetical protein CI102_14072 [Trichoderma harzianum]|nr:hypothetical protein CI102_14072 [Trichoderma harzianum]